MHPRFAEQAQGEARQAYLCAAAIFPIPAERAALFALTHQQLADGPLWRTTTSAAQEAATALLQRGVISAVPEITGAYLLTPFGGLVAGALTLICLDADP